MTNLDSIIKSRDITLPTKVRLVKAYGFSSNHVWIWELDCKESSDKLMLLNCGVGEDSWESYGLQGDPTSPFWRSEGMMLKLKLQFFGHLMQRVDSLEKTLMLGGIGGRKRRGQQRMWWLDGITDSMDVSLGELRSWWWTGTPGVLRFMGSQSRTRLSDWTELNWCVCFNIF